MATKTITGRTLTVKVTIHETREGTYYGQQEVASMDFSATLPVSAQAVAQATGDAVQTLARQVDIFRGAVPVDEALVDA